MRLFHKVDYESILPLFQRMSAQFSKFDASTWYMYSLLCNLILVTQLAYEIFDAQELYKKIKKILLLCIQKIYDIMFFMVATNYISMMLYIIKSLVDLSIHIYLKVFLHCKYFFIIMYSEENFQNYPKRLLKHK